MAYGVRPKRVQECRSFENGKLTARQTAHNVS